MSQLIFDVETDPQAKVEQDFRVQNQDYPHLLDMVLGDEFSSQSEFANAVSKSVEHHGMTLEGAAMLANIAVIKSIESPNRLAA